MAPLLFVLLGFVLGFLAAALLLRPDLYRGSKDAGVVEPTAAKAKVTSGSEALKVSEDYAPRHVFTAAMEEAAQLILQAAAEAASDWHQFDSRNGVTFMQKEMAGFAVPLLRGDALIDAPPMGLMQLILDEAHSKVFDPQLKRMEILERLDEQSDVVYTEFNGVGPVAGRDFCVLRHFRSLPGGGVLVLNTSVEHPACEAAQGRGLVRGTTPFNGWVLRPVETSQGTLCAVIFVANVFLNGSLPKFLLRQVAREAPEKVLHLKRIAAECRFDNAEDQVEQQKMLVQQGRTAIEQLQVDASQQGWEHEMTKHDIKIYRKTDSLHKFKGEGVIPVPTADIQRVLLNIEQTMQWDPMCREASLLAKVDDSTRVVYLKQEAKKCFVKSARDFCLVHAHTVRTDGSFVLAGASIEHPKCPVRSDTVRADLQCGGWIVTSTDDGRQSHITYVVQVDSRGGVPTQLLDQIAMRVPLAIHYLGLWVKAHSQ